MPGQQRVYGSNKELVTPNLVAGGQVTKLRNQRPLGETSHQRQRHLTLFPATASTTQQQQQRKKD